MNIETVSAYAPVIAMRRLYVVSRAKASFGGAILNGWTWEGILGSEGLKRGIGMFKRRLGHAGRQQSYMVDKRTESLSQNGRRCS